MFDDLNNGILLEYGVDDLRLGMNEAVWLIKEMHLVDTLIEEMMCDLENEGIGREYYDRTVRFSEVFDK
jgi:hypothetical protein